MIRNNLPRMLMLLVLSVSSAALAAQDMELTKPKVNDLGGGRVQIGTITLDKNTGSFVAPGQVIRLEPPLEFLAVAKGGVKAYESVLELDANAFEFNMACILIGLDADKGSPARYHFDERTLEGDAVEIKIAWEDKNGNLQSRLVGNMLMEGDKQVTTEGWVYTGSVFTPDNKYLAVQDGTIIGFVHDPASVIEHAKGLGLGDYGVVSVNMKQAPPLGARISLQVRKKD